MKKRKILFFCPVVGRGGMHTVAETLIRSLAEAGRVYYQFAILGQQYDEHDLKVAWPGWVDFEQIGPMDRLPPHPYLFKFLKEHREDFTAHLKRKMESYQPDLVFCLSPWWTMPVDDADWPLGETPFVTLIPDMAFDTLEGAAHIQHFREAAHLIARRSSLTVFPSAHWRDHAVTKYHFPVEKTEVIHFSADYNPPGFSPTPQEARRVRAKYSLPDQYVLAFHCYGHKDPVTILRGQQYARSHAHNVPPLVMAGIETENYLSPPMSDHVRTVQKTIKQIGATLGKDLFILGRLPDEDVGGLFAGATASLWATKMEGDISAGMFNAITARTPMIYSDLPVFRDRLGITEGFGLTFPVGSATALGSKIGYLCNHRHETEERTHAAYDLFHRRTAIDVARSYLRVFRQATHTKNRLGVQESDWVIYDE